MGLSARDIKNSNLFNSNTISRNQFELFRNLKKNKSSIIKTKKQIFMGKKLEKIFLMIKPIFSIIIPTYNSLKTLDKTIRSVLKQSFKYYEIIIVDDGSTDNTYTKLRGFQDTRIKLFKIKRSGGPARPRNFGISKSSSDWICFRFR